MKNISRSIFAPPASTAETEDKAGDKDKAIVEDEAGDKDKAGVEAGGVASADGNADGDKDKAGVEAGEAGSKAGEAGDKEEVDEAIGEAGEDDEAIGDEDDEARMLAIAQELEAVKDPAVEAVKAVEVAAGESKVAKPAVVAEIGSGADQVPTS